MGVLPSQVGNLPGVGGGGGVSPWVGLHVPVTVANTWVDNYYSSSDAGLRGNHSAGANYTIGILHAIRDTFDSSDVRTLFDSHDGSNAGHRVRMASGAEFSRVQGKIHGLSEGTVEPPVIPSGSPVTKPYTGGVQLTTMRVDNAGTPSYGTSGMGVNESSPRINIGSGAFTIATPANDFFLGRSVGGADPMKGQVLGIFLQESLLTDEQLYWLWQECQLLQGLPTAAPNLEESPTLDYVWDVKTDQVVGGSALTTWNAKGVQPSGTRSMSLTEAVAGNMKIIEVNPRMSIGNSAP